MRFLNAAARLATALAMSVAMAASAQVPQDQEEPWFQVAQHGTWKLFAKRGSHQMMKNNSGEKISIATFAFHHDDQITYERRYARLSQCAAGQGQVVTVNLEGQVLYGSDFILDGGVRITDDIARMLCTAAAQHLATQQKPVQKPVKKSTPPSLKNPNV